MVLKYSLTHSLANLLAQNNLHSIHTHYHKQEYPKTQAHSKHTWYAMYGMQLHCVRTLIRCPIGCGTLVERRKMDVHLKDQCPKREVPCPLGCDEVEA